MKDKSAYVLSAILFVCFVLSASCLAVSSKITRHSSMEDFLKGRTENIVVGSRGTVQLGRAAEVIVEKFEDTGQSPEAKKSGSEPWSINSIVVSGEAVFIGTSPNGGIYKYSLGKLTKIYTANSDKKLNAKSSGGDVNEPEDAAAVEAEQYLSNEHIFAMTTDVAGRLLAGISGERCRLIRFEAGQMETIFEPNDAKYIFAIATGETGDIYLATGPEGKVYRLDSFGKEPELVYDSVDKNILSLAIGKDGFVYAGSDGRGLVYKINPRTKKATVLYDSEQEEITALLFLKNKGNGDLYAAATSAEITKAETEFAVPLILPGRPEAQMEKKIDDSQNQGELKLKIANTNKGDQEKPSPEEKPASRGIRPGKASYIYKINSEGFVTNIFNRPAVFFCMAAEDEKLLVGTGNTAQLFSITPAAEQEEIVYEDRQASQITAAVVLGGDIYLGTANAAKLIKLGAGFAQKGTYISDFVDAGQPARWGKLQIEADIPEGCKILMACRSGNVKDVNDPTFSEWTQEVEVTEPVQLACPLGRFCQYKLILESQGSQTSPVVKEVAVASTVENLAPQVESVSVSRIETTGAVGKTGVFKISYQAKDDNNDKLIYKIDFRKPGRTNWIEIEDKIETDSFEWDGKTVEDGRYEIRVTASDERSNTAATKLTGSRVSDAMVVDNSGPDIRGYSIQKEGTTVRLVLQVSDALSVIGSFQYTVDSNADWIGTLPDDMVYDTMDEDFKIVIEGLEAGEHVITVKVSDDVGNTTYKSFDVNLDTKS